MSDVYLVWYDDYESEPGLCGVFSTRRKAEKYIDYQLEGSGYVPGDFSIELHVPNLVNNRKY